MATSKEQTVGEKLKRKQTLLLAHCHTLPKCFLLHQMVENGSKYWSSIRGPW